MTATQAFDAPEADGQSNEDATSGDRVLRVDLAVKNYGKKSITVDDADVTVVAASRRDPLKRYTGAASRSSGGQELFHEEIKPGEGRVGHLFFGLPRDASGLVLVVKGPAHSNVFGNIDLGM